MTSSIAPRLAMLLTLMAAPVLSQDPDPLSRLDQSSRFAVEMILDSARAAAIPPAPLLSKAYEGISKRADSRKVVAAVRSLFGALKEARSALGGALTEPELTAAASAVQAGVPMELLGKFRSARPGKRAVPLVVLADLITRGVPVDTASSAIIKLWQGGAADADFYGLWKGVEQDILSGATPGAAILQRTREFPGKAPGKLPQPPSERQPETPSS